jgi:hypothetical protein
MSDNETSKTKFDQFMQHVLQRTLPTNPMGRIRTLAKELAEGAAAGIWGAALYGFRGNISDQDVMPYFEQRWAGESPHIGLLVTNGYLQWEGNSAFITKAAFDLIDEAEPSSIFISYRRSESSAFALLVLARLKAAGLNAFLDLTIQPGDNWRIHLKEEIKQRGHLVLLLGKQTLSSEIVQQEVEWAVQTDATVIPIWHNGFAYKSGDFTVSPAIDNLLQNTHTIRVLEESALAYNNAIIELLNYFGVTP